MSFAALTMITQYGLVVMNHFPRWGGILCGFAVAAALSLVRLGATRVRAHMVTGAVLLFAAVAVSLHGPPAGAEASSGTCTVTLEPGPGISGTTLLNNTSKSGPVRLDKEVATVSVRIELPTPAPPAATWRVWVPGLGFNPGGRPLTEGSQGGTQPIKLPSERVPGLYEVHAEAIGVCQSITAYVRIEGSPFTNPLGLAGVGAGVLGSFALARAFGASPGRSWWVAPTDDVEHAVVDPATGRRVRKPLQPGRPYELLTTIRFPDKPERYAPLADPVEVISGVFGSRAPSLANVDPSAGQTTARHHFEVPAASDQPFELSVDIAHSGNLLRSVRLSGPRPARSHGRTPGQLSQLIGRLTYRAGALGAQDLLSLQPIDAMIVLHGSRSTDYVEIWSLRGESSLRVAGHNRISVADLDHATSAYRAALEGAIADADAGRSGGPAMLALAVEGARLGGSLLGAAGTAAPAGGRVGLHHDTDAIGMMTIPWAGIYGGPARASASLRLCDAWQSNDFDCASHADDVVCPSWFFGLRYELISPGGWLPERYGSRRLFAGRRRLRPSATAADALAWRLPNSRPARLLVVGGAPDLELQLREHAAEIRAAGDVAVDVAESIDGLGAELRSGIPYDVVYFFTHHGYADAAPVPGRTAVERQSHALELDRALDDRELRLLMGEKRLDHGPVVFINACESGVVRAHSYHALLAAFQSLGARAVVVTETQVVPALARQAGRTLLEGLFDGVELDRALLSARRHLVADRGSLAMLAYTVYGPPGLRFSNRVAALPSPRPTAS